MQYNTKRIYYSPISLSKKTESEAREATVSDQHTRWRKVRVYGYVLNFSHKLQHGS